MPRIVHTLALAASLAFAAPLAAQTGPETPRFPPDYRGVHTHVSGIFVTPVDGAAFTASVHIVSHEQLSNGSEQIRTTTVQIARTSSGRIYNEMRVFRPAAAPGQPPLLSAHIYDPSSRTSVFLDPRTHLARQTILPQPPHAQTGQTPGTALPGEQVEDLGEQELQGLTLKGIRKTRTVAAMASDTGKTLTIVDEYWYSPDLSIYLIIRHDDPRTGEQLVAVDHIDRAEPNASLFTVPPDYKLVDETPPPPPARQTAVR